MESRLKDIRSTRNPKARIKVMNGHFATSLSHVNTYIDMSTVKCRHNNARETAKTLAATYADMDVLRAASPEELQNLPDIGPEVASSIKAFFDDEPNVALLARLRELGLWPVRQ